jgi:hypothetical protein
MQAGSSLAGLLYEQGGQEGHGDARFYPALPSGFEAAVL